jgi:hypothetical protein
VEPGGIEDSAGMLVPEADDEFIRVDRFDAEVFEDRGREIA